MRRRRGRRGMTLSLLCGPAGSGKTTRAIDAFLAAHDRGEKAVFIAPSGPDARHFERRIIRALGDEKNPGVLRGGKVTTYGGLCHEILAAAEPGARFLSGNERFLLLRAIVDTTDNLHSLAPSSTFDGFVNALAGLLGEMELLGIDATRMGESLRSWAGNDEWRQGLNKDLYRFFESYEAALGDMRVYDSQLAQRKALAALEESPALLEYETVIIDGFWDFTPIQHEFIEQMSSAANSLLVTLPFVAGRVAYLAPAGHVERLKALDGVQTETLESPTKSDRAPALSHLADSLFEEDPGKVSAPGAVFRMKGAGSRGQATMVAAQILKLWRKGQDLDEIAIVCRSLEQDMYSIAAALEEFGVPYDLPAPVPLTATAAGRTVMAALDFAAGSRSRDSLFVYLRSPFSDIPREKVDEFDRRCRLFGIEDTYDLLMECKIRCGDPLEEINRLASAAAKGVEALGDELRRFVRSFFKKPHYIDGVLAETLKIDILALESLSALCDEAGTAGKIIEGAAPLPDGQERGNTDSAGLLLRGIRQASIRMPALTHRNCVRLLDPHRILNQHFNMIFVCGLLEKQFPSLGREDSFFSDADRRELSGNYGIGLDSRKGRLDEERFLYHRTLSRARDRVYLCYPACDKEGKPTIPSLFVDDTLDLFEKDSITSREMKIGDLTFTPGEAPTAEQAVRSLALLSGTAEKTDRVLIEAAAAAGLGARLEKVLGACETNVPVISDPEVIARLAGLASFRVTELQRYLKCPFRYFVEKVLDPTDMEPLGHGLKRGQVMHDVLCKFGAQLKRSELYLNDPGIKPEQIAEVRRQMAGYIEEELIDAGSDLETLILKEELSWHLNRYIDREIASVRPLKYYDFEVSFGASTSKCGGKNDTDNVLPMGDFNLRGRLDRVDWQGDRDNALVIDYKASKQVASFSSFEKDREIQLPLYILALREAFGLTPIGGEYYSLRGEKRRGLYLEGYDELIGSSSSEMSKKDIVDSETFERALETAKTLAREAADGIRTGSFSTALLNSKNECEWCGLSSVCRSKSLPEMIDGLADD
jgi:ATP-dependent helicase/DNAse subunit B